ncbi:hypothetical protein E3O53_03220 [Cryobacterium sp. TMT2-18-3]|nr:hypothetical protein E3O22_09440 [Cryobacterium sp. TMT2-18-2]TFC66761.1 hypothetical protein E3O53_03220 [Cryobacterium sp. TMT2-18-3]
MSKDSSSRPERESDASLSAELHEARLEIRALRSELAQVAPVIADLKRQVVAAKAQGERYRRQVEILRLSLSWRVTQPLRVLRRRGANANR